MRAANVLKLSEWVEKNKAGIIGGGLTQPELATHAEKELSMKVPVSTLVDILRAHGIQTRRRSESAVKIEQLTLQRDQYRQWLLRCIDAAAVRDWLLDEMREAFHADVEIVKAINRKKNSEAA